jgi:hypothetical protein
MKLRNKLRRYRNQISSDLPQSAFPANVARWPTSSDCPIAHNDVSLKSDGVSQLRRVAEWRVLRVVRAA